MKKESLCCVIVTFNRKELLLRNILCILKQKYSTDKIVIIDNHSDEPTLNYLRNNLNEDTLEIIHYKYLNENIGGAGGFSIGLKTAFDLGYDWFLLMDDDGFPKNDDCISNLFSFIYRKSFNSEKLILLNSLVEAEHDNNLLSFGLGHIDNVNDALKISKDGGIINLINPFNGTLISRGLVSKIGFPNKDFFIKGDEVDYYLRALKCNSYIATVVSSEYIHPMVKNRKTIKIFGHKMYIFVESPIKEYYSIRNFTYSSLINFDKKSAKKRNIGFYLKRIICILFSKCNKKETFKMIRKGYEDGKSGKLGIFKQ